MALSTYPKADRTAQWFAGRYPGSAMTPRLVVWHTTETGGWPGYSSGASAPHFTYHASERKLRQHFPVDRSSRALRNEPGGVETNTAGAVQVEIIAYSDERLAGQRGHLPVSRLPLAALEELAALARWLHDEHGVPLDVDPGWLRDDFNDPPMSMATWRSFRGHCGHNRVPENTHWDPGRLDIDTLMKLARRGQAPTPTPPEEDDDMPYSKWPKADKDALANDLIRKLLAHQVPYDETTQSGMIMGPPDKRGNSVLALWKYATHIIRNARQEAWIRSLVRKELDQFFANERFIWSEASGRNVSILTAIQSTLAGTNAAHTSTPVQKLRSLLARQVPEVEVAPPADADDDQDEPV